MPNPISFSLRRVNAVDVPHPFYIVNLTGRVEFPVRPGGRSGATWRIILEVRPLYPTSRGPRGINQAYFPCALAGDAFPPRMFISNISQNFFFRTWEDGRVAAGSFMVSSRGIEEFYFGVGRLPVMIHDEEEIINQRIIHRFDNLRLGAWYAAAGLNGYNRHTFAAVVFDYVGRTVSMFNECRN
ncbi:hypothetical protein CAC42_2708 [Sphaceloma murrayae]|uniref:Uncharacterized protein n=1 Tax=Sphaceloma murrayae TaxID=2082308 RepID=A0A2K1R0G1_9PEZI|nr:hypothetical protein CAC42_2708 [Sphaceloma murrayae]